jgi:transcriptional regulator with XRE-family HTH domain
MTNVVRQIREAAGMSQSDFARAIGRSLQMLRNYEHGAKPPDDVIERIQSIAVQHASAHLAAVLVKEWEVKRVIQPGETLIGAHRPAAAGPYNPKNKHLHDMLEMVLESGNRKAIDAVVPNLVVFSDYVSHMSGRGIPAKKTGKR